MGVEAVNALLRAIPTNVKSAVASQVRKEADGLADAIRAVTPVKSGALRSSIKVTETPGRELSITISAGGAPAVGGPAAAKFAPGTAARQRALGRVRRAKSQKGAFYGRFVEFGHKTKTGGYVPPHPFFFGLYRSRRSAMRRRISNAVRKAFQSTSTEG